MNKKPIYVREYKDRHGIHRLQFRRKGHKSWNLRPPLRSKEFWEDYEAALNGDIPPGVTLKHNPRPDPITKPGSSSLKWLIQEYKGAAAFRKLQTRTQIVRAAILDRLSEEYGHLPYSRLKRHHILKLRDEMADKPEAANGMLKALRQVFKYGIEYSVPRLTNNPTRDVPYLKSNNPNGHHSWTPEEVEQFEATHSVGTKAHLAMALLLYTGQRRSDVVRLGRQHLKGGRLEFTQQKNRNSNPVQLSIPVLPELQRIMDISPCGDMNFLVTQHGKPYTVDGFGNWFRRMCDKAGLENCSAHGLRKAAATRLAEIGCTDHEIMAITGHRTLKELQRYTAAARQKVLADNAINKVQEDIERTKVSYLSDGHASVRQLGPKK